MKPIALITGGTGFIGAHLCAFLVKKGWDIVVVDDGSASRVDNLRYLGIDSDIVMKDLSDPHCFDFWEGPPPDTIFHLAGNANVARSVELPRMDFNATLLSTFNVLEFARHRGVRKIVFPSTASVYKPGVPMPIQEDAPIHASSPYGAAKVAAENYCFAYAKSYGVDVTVLRFFNIYGPLMCRFVIHDMVRKLQHNPCRLEILGDGNQIREYLYVEDAARSLLVAAEKGLAGEVYNAGTGIPIRIRDLAQSIITEMGLTNVEVIYTMQSWPGDIRTWYADTSKFSVLGFKPLVSWDEGLVATVRFLAEHPKGLF